MLKNFTNTFSSVPLLLSAIFLVLSFFSQNTHALPFGLKLRWDWPWENLPTVGYEYWGSRDIPKIGKLPSGQLTGVVEGDSVFVDKAGGSFLSVGNLCNWCVYTLTSKAAEEELADKRQALFNRLQELEGGHSRANRRRECEGL